MGCGSWGGNSIDDNLNWTHFVNCVRIARQIKPVEPTVDEIFADYFAETDSDPNGRINQADSNRRRFIKPG